LERDEIILFLRRFKESAGHKYSIRRIGFFGSAATGSMKKESDIDVVVDLVDPNLFNLIGIKLELEEQLHLPVDVVRYHQKMNKFLKKRIDKDAVYV